MNLAEYYGGSPVPAVKKTLNYLSDLSNNTGHPIAHWDLDEVFGENDIAGYKTLVCSPREINKRFFEKVKLDAVKSDEKLNAMSQEDIEKLHRFDREMISTRRKNLDELIARELRNINDYAANIAAFQTKVRDFREQRLAINQDSTKWVNEVCSLDFFTLDRVGEFHDPFIYFTTKPIVLSMKRPADGLEMRVPFGTYTVKVGATRATIALLKYEDNIRVDDYYHPFVSYNGNICWGTAQTAVSDMIASSNWAPVMKLLASLLTTYPGTTPYKSLEDFFIRGRDSNGNQPWIEKAKVSGDITVDSERYCRWCNEDGIRNLDDHCENPDDHENECGGCGSMYFPGSDHTCHFTCGECDAEWDGDYDDHDCPARDADF